MKRAGFLLGFVLLLHSISASAFQAERPSPASKALGVSANPFLLWNVSGGENILENGGFESGLNNWSIVRGQVITPVTFSAFEGTNVLKIDYGSLTRNLTLPLSGTPIVWSFAILNSISFPPHAFAEVQTSDGVPLRRLDFFRQGGASSGWQTFGADLSDLAGQAIRIFLRFDAVDTGVYSYLDDFRVTVFPPEVAFDVYFGRSASINYLGRTTSASWPVGGLSPNSPYKWRVDTIANGATNAGPVWEFTTSGGVPQAAGMDFLPIPPFICPDAFVPLTAFFRDYLGFRAGVTGQIKVSAGADDVRPASVAITEVDTGVNDAAEFMNVSNASLDLKGWQVQFLTFPAVTVTLPTGSILPPGGIFTVTENDTQNHWPNLGAAAINWTETTNGFAAGVILRDAASNVVDCVFIDTTYPNSANYDNQRSSISAADWIDAPINFSAGARTYQRVGRRDSNQRSDWVVANSTMRAINSGLEIPFEPGFGVIAALFSPKASTAGGQLTTSVQFPTSRRNVRLLAQSNRYFGATPPFEVVGPGFCISLSAPASVPEKAGTIAGGLRVVLSAPVATTTTINLHNSNNDAIHIPATVEFPAGSSEATVDITVIDNDELQGPQFTTITADAPGYSGALASIKIEDDEPATLSIIAPDTIVEADVPTIMIESSAAPSAYIDLVVTLGDPPFGRYFPQLAPGSKQASFQISDDPLLEDNALATIKVEGPGPNWIAATQDVQFIDHTPHTIALNPPSFIGEEQIVRGSATLGGIPYRDTIVSLASSRPELVSVPATITFPPFTQSVYFDFSAPKNDLAPGHQTVDVTATSPTFSAGSASITVYQAPVGPTLITTLSADRSKVIITVPRNTTESWRYRLLECPTVDGVWREILPSADYTPDSIVFTIPLSGVMELFKVALGPPD